MDENYWAGESDLPTLVADLLERVKTYRSYISDTGVASKARRCWSAYYGRGVNSPGDTSRLLVAGENQHLVKQSANIVAQLVDLSLNALLRNKPAYIAVSKNSDYESKAQAPLATGLIDEYDRRLSLSEIERRAVKTAWLTTMGWVSLGWDESLGDDIGAAPGIDAQKAGDIETSMHTVFDVYYDTGIENVNDIPWLIVRKRVNKWDLASRYPEHKLDILKESSNATMDNTDGDWIWASYKQTQQSDYVWMYEFRHKPTASLPAGRLVRYIGDTAIEDVQIEGMPAYPYGDDLLCYQVTPDQMVGSSIGHTPIADLLGLQEGHDLAFSAIASVINAGGIINWWVPPGSGIKVAEMDGNLNVVTSTVKPEAIGGAVIQPGVQTYMQMSETLMRQRLAVNDVVAGDVSKGIPAQAIAALQAQFFEFHGGLQNAYVSLVQNIRTGVLKLLKKFAHTERVALLAGHANGYQYKAFSSGDLNSIERIVVQPVGAATRTPAGRLDMAEKLLNMHLIDGPKFMDVINTGQVDFTDDENQAYTLKLDADKAMLREGIGLAPMDPSNPRDVMGTPNYLPGKGLRPMATDDFVRDIKAYRGVLFDPDSRSNPQVCGAVIEVIEECQRLHRQGDPYFQAILGIQPPPPPMPPEMMEQHGQQMAGQPPQGQHQGPSLKQSPRDARNSQSQPDGAPSTSLPKPPPNPLTGEQQQSPMAQQ